jgi:hypothetical protein
MEKWARVCSHRLCGQNSKIWVLYGWPTIQALLAFRLYDLIDDHRSILRLCRSRPGLRLTTLGIVGVGTSVDCDSPVNRAIAEELWAQFLTRNHLDGVTTFKAAETDSAEEMLIENLDTIDLHHGFYSADPPYTVLEIVGARLTARIEAALTDLGFDSFPITNDGFRAIRPLAAANKSVI